MKRESTLKWQLTPLWFWLLVAVLLASGVFFRFYNLDHKIYWFDEAITSHLVSGYSNEELKCIFQDKVITASDFLVYHRLEPRKGLLAPLELLIDEDPVQQPIYYLIANVWMQFWMIWFDDTIVIMRSLSAVISLVAFPCMYWLCLELFKSHRVGVIAIVLLAVSPFHVLYAQEARVYSLWTVVILLSCASFLWALRVKTRISWIIYVASLALGFYTHLFFWFIVFGHGFYAFKLVKSTSGRPINNFLLATTAAFLVYLPWVFVVLTNNLTGIYETTTWTTAKTDFTSLVFEWSYGLTTIFLDYDYGAEHPLFSVSPPVLGILVLLAFSFAFFIHHASKHARFFLFTLMLTNFLPLLVLDLTLGGMRSAIPRYLIPLYVGIQLSVAYFFNEQIFDTKTKLRRRGWQLILLVLLTISVLSCAISSQYHVWWNKDIDEQLPEAAQVINRAQSPLVVSDAHFGALWSLTYLLDQNVELLIVVDTSTSKLPEGTTEIFLYRPSQDLKKSLEKDHKIIALNCCKGMWRIKKSTN